MKKIILSISIIVTVLIAGGFFLYPRLSIVIPTKMFFSKNKTPEAYIIPVERPIKTSFGDIDPISEHSCEWFKFKVPWEIIDTMVLGNSTFFRFINTKGIVIAKQNENESIVKSLLGNNNEDAYKMKALLGEENLKSEYDIINLCLNTSPDQATLFTPLKDLVKVPTMLVLKAMFTADKIYKFSTNNLRGFQFVTNGDSSFTNVHLFDSKNQVFEIKFVSVSQNEIDFILSSIEML